MHAANVTPKDYNETAATLLPLQDFCFSTAREIKYYGRYFSWELFSGSFRGKSRRSYGTGASWLVRRKAYGKRKFSFDISTWFFIAGSMSQEGLFNWHRRVEVICFRPWVVLESVFGVILTRFHKKRPVFHTKLVGFCGGNILVTLTLTLSLEIYSNQINPVFN